MTGETVIAVPDPDVRVELPGGFVVDTDRGRLDLERVHRWLSTDAYWALGRSREFVERAAAASVNFGVYGPGGAQVGYARVVTDGVALGGSATSTSRARCVGVGSGSRYPGPWWKRSGDSG